MTLLARECHNIASRFVANYGSYSYLNSLDLNRDPVLEECVETLRLVTPAALSYVYSLLCIWAALLVVQSSSVVRLISVTLPPAYSADISSPTLIRKVLASYSHCLMGLWLQCVGAISDYLVGLGLGGQKVDKNGKCVHLFVRPYICPSTVWSSRFGR